MFSFKEFKEFEINDFIILRNISENTSLAYYKQENQLVVIKYKEEYIDHISSKILIINK